MIKSAVWDEDELATIQNKDRLLPSQPYFSKMYRGKDFYGDLNALLSAMSPPKIWDIKTKDGMTYAVMGSDLNTLSLYQFLIKLRGYKRVLELGTYIGVSAMHMAGAGAYVTTVEKGDEFSGIASRNIKANGFDKRISLVNEDAIQYLKRIRSRYDLIFIDCAKESYKELLELSIPRLLPKGLILIDDVFFQGDTLNESPTSEKGAGVKAMIEYAATLKDWEKVILPIGNGLMMMHRK